MSRTTGRRPPRRGPRRPRWFPPHVFVAHVAPADHRGLVVRGERLVVHAAVDAGEVRHVVAYPPAPVGEGIEQPQLDVGVRVQGGEQGVEALGVDVVQQHAHAHAAFGCIPQRAREKGAADVRVPDVVLHVDAALAACASACRAAKASRPATSAWAPDCPGCAAAGGPSRRPSVVCAVSVSASELTRGGARAGSRKRRARTRTPRNARSWTGWRPRPPPCVSRRSGVGSRSG
jgi:hypothetical protein